VLLSLTVPVSRILAAFGFALRRCLLIQAMRFEDIRSRRSMAAPAGSRSRDPDFVVLLSFHQMWTVAWYPRRGRVSRPAGVGHWQSFVALGRFRAAPFDPGVPILCPGGPLAGEDPLSEIYSVFCVQHGRSLHGSCTRFESHLAAHWQAIFLSLLRCKRPLVSPIRRVTPSTLSV